MQTEREKGTSKRGIRGIDRTKSLPSRICRLVNISFLCYVSAVLVSPHIGEAFSIFALLEPNYMHDAALTATFLRRLGATKREQKGFFCSLSHH